MTYNETDLSNKVNEIIRFVNETRIAMFLEIPPEERSRKNELLSHIFQTGSKVRGGLYPDVLQLKYFSQSDIDEKKRAGKNKRKTTRKKSLKY